MWRESVMVRGARRQEKWGRHCCRPHSHRRWVSEDTLIAWRLASACRSNLAAYVARRSRRCRMGLVIRGVRRQLQFVLPFRGRSVATWRLERSFAVLQLLPISTPGRNRSGLSGDGALRGISSPVSSALSRDCLVPFLLRAGFRLRVDLVRCPTSGSAGDPSVRSVAATDG